MNGATGAVHFLHSYGDLRLLAAGKCRRKRLLKYRERLISVYDLAIDKEGRRAGNLCRLRRAHVLFNDSSIPAGVQA